MMRVGKFAFLALVICLAPAEARERGHLIPVEPTFDVKGPYAKTYARLREEKLFAGPNWVLRYHSSSNVELGVSISKRQDGKYWVTVKQAKPPLPSILALARNQKWNLQWALNTVEFHQAHAEVPETTVESILDYSLSLLTDVRPLPQSLSPMVISNKVTLFAKAPRGRVLEGQLPPDAAKYRHIYAVEDIVDDLVGICAEPQENHDVVFRHIEEKARRFSRGEH
jgi:hypothetical protein